MRAEPSCPRCGGGLKPPGLWSSSWECDQHGAVPPLQPVVQPNADVLNAVAAQSAVPVWLPWPLPKGWLVTGIGHAGDERTGARATAVACSGPAPLGGAGDLVLVAEEPGVGLGARFAGLEGPDPGEAVLGHPADAKIHAAGHPTAMWSIPGADDRAAYVGEALGMWLWAVLWPETAGFLLIDEFVLTDLRDAGLEMDIPFGALSPRLSG
ncbi:MAG: DUF6758 family protein [Acidimicrobiales bacterium]